MRSTVLSLARRLIIVRLSILSGAFPAAFLHERSLSANMPGPGGIGGTADDDAVAYNTISSSAVDLGVGYVRNSIFTVTRSCRDLDSNSKRTFVYKIPLGHQFPPASSISASDKQDVLKQSIFLPPYELSSKIKLMIPSPSGNKIAILVEEPIPTANGVEAASPAVKHTRQVFEIWTDGGSRLERRCVLPKKLHGKVSTDRTWFGGVSWRPRSEDALVYVAEEAPPETHSFFRSNSKPEDDPGKDAEDRSVETGKQFTLGVGKLEDWGEKYTGTARLRLFLLNTETGNIGAINNIPGANSHDPGNTIGGYTLGQPVFSPCQSSVVYTAWDAGGGGEMPRRLGATYCYQRPSRIYSSSIEKLLNCLSNTTSNADSTNADDECECITPGDRLVRSPRFSHATSKLVFVCNTKGFDTHDGCMGIDVMDWDADRGMARRETRTKLVDVVDIPQYDESESRGNAILGMSFPGLFLNQLPDECFSPEGDHIFLSSMWGSVSRVLRISMIDGSIKALQFSLDRNEGANNSEFCSQSVLCVSEDGVVVTESSPNRPAVIGRLPLKQPNDGIVNISELIAKFPPVSGSSISSIPSDLSNFGGDIAWRVMTMKSDDDDNQNVPFQSVLLLPNRKTSDGKLPPLIVVPHGGPHSCTSTTFLPPYAFLCGHGGYAVLEVNFRGSTGFGQKFLESLPGNAGSVDVNDVAKATQTVIDEGLVDGSRVGICGGSHGGFLAGHMIGQYPELFKVAAMRNPVTNIPTMTTPTDIADWCYVESFGPGSYDWSKFRPATKEQLAQMWDMSPIAHLDKVKAPTLVALGMSDRRVPPSQGIEYYHALRSKGITTKLLLYEEDDHAIDHPVSEADHWINVKQWFDAHLLDA